MLMLSDCRRDVSGGSVESMLVTMPGVNSSNELSSQYSVRGGSFDENSVYINGTEIYRPQLLRSGEQEGLSIINPDMVGNIRFSSGGFPARYADKMSSALDISYRDPMSFEMSGTASLMGGCLSIGQNSGIFSQLHGLRLRKNNSLLSSLDTKGEYDPTYFDYQTNMTLKASEKFSVNLLGNISVNDFRFQPTDRETSFGTVSDIKHFRVYFDGAEKDKFETYLANLSFNYNRSRRSSFSISIGAFMTNELVSYDISGEYWLDQAGTSGENGLQSGGELGIGKYMEHSRNRLKASVLSASLRGNLWLAATIFRMVQLLNTIIFTTVRKNGSGGIALAIHCRRCPREYILFQIFHRSRMLRPTVFRHSLRTLCILRPLNLLLP